MLLHLNLKDQMYFNLKIPTYCNVSYVTLLLIALENHERRNPPYLLTENTIYTKIWLPQFL